MDLKPPYSFHSSDEVVMDWWRAWDEGRRAHDEALARIAPELAPWEGAKPAVTGALGQYSFDGYMRDWMRPVPDGWRAIGPNQKWIRPKKSTKEGKAILARMTEVPPLIDARYKPGIPGVQTGPAPYPEGDGWEENGEGHDFWERFDYHEEHYWRRRKANG